MATILLVEDNELNADMLVRRLERRGFAVLLATTGLEAVAMTVAHTPDVVLMDVNLPDIDGFEATRRLKLDPVTAEIPIIALTAHAMSDDRDQSYAAGCVDFESKPIDFARLVEKITAWCRAAVVS